GFGYDYRCFGQNIIRTNSRCVSYFHFAHSLVEHWVQLCFGCRTAKALFKTTGKTYIGQYFRASKRRIAQRFWYLRSIARRNATAYCRLSERRFGADYWWLLWDESRSYPIDCRSGYPSKCLANFIGTA